VVCLAPAAIRSVTKGATRSLVRRELQVNVPPTLPMAWDCALRVERLRQPISVVSGIATASASAAPSLTRAAAIAVSAKLATQLLAPVLAVPRVRPVKTDSAPAPIPAFAVPSKIVRGLLNHRGLAVSAVVPQRGVAHVGLTTFATTCRAAPALPIARQIASVWSTRAVERPSVSNFAQRTGHPEQYTMFRPEAAPPVVTFSSN